MSSGLAQPPTDSSLEQESVLRLIYEVHLSLSREFNRKMRHMGLTRPQWEVLTVIRTMSGATQTEIADLMDMGRSPLGKIIDKLEGMGLLQRRPDEDDRRVNRVFLTQKFEPMIEPLREVRKEVQARAFSDMKPAQQSLFLEILHTMNQSLHK